MNAKRTLLTSALIGGLAVGGYFLAKNDNPQVQDSNGRAVVAQQEEKRDVNTRQYLTEKLAEIQGKGIDFLVPDVVAEKAMRHFLEQKSGYSTETQRALSSARHTVLDDVLKPGFSNDNDYGNAAYFSWSISWPGYLEGTGLQPSDLENMSPIYDTVLNAGKNAVSNPTTLMAFVRGKEDVARQVLSEYSQNEEGQGRLQDVDKYLTTVQEAIGVTRTEKFRETHKKYLTAVQEWRDSPDENPDHMDKFSAMQGLESELTQLTPDYHASMFAMRRFGQGGEAAVKGLEEATTFARNLVAEYVAK